MELPKRKNNRLNNFDYSQPGVYFITICVKNRKTILSNIIVGANIVRPKEIHLTKYGEIVETAIKNIPQHYPSIRIDNYVIMPDHIHLLLQINTNKNGRPMVAPTVDRIIKQTKGYITKQIGFSIWQKSFYDHIVRGNNDYKEIWEYIENNPLK
jgi:REP element-mobilizing transposase RayT